jgi:hypothetical protein
MRTSDTDGLDIANRCLLANAEALGCGAALTEGLVLISE